MGYGVIANWAILWCQLGYSLVPTILCIIVYSWHGHKNIYRAHLVYGIHGSNSSFIVTDITVSYRTDSHVIIIIQNGIPLGLLLSPN